MWDGLNRKYIVVDGVVMMLIGSKWKEMVG